MTRFEDLKFRPDPERRHFLYDAVGWKNGFEMLIDYIEGPHHSRIFNVTITPPEEMNRGVLRLPYKTTEQVKELMEKTESGGWEASDFPEPDET